MGIGCGCQDPLPLGRKTHMGEPSPTCMALPQEAKVASERLMGHLALCVLIRETGKSFLKASSGFWQRFQGTGLKAARWPLHTFSFSILAFLFPHSLSPSCIPLLPLLISSLVFCPPQMISAFPFICPVILSSSCPHLSGVGGDGGILCGGKTQVLECSLGFQPNPATF